MGAGWLNLASVGLGLLAWALPLVSLATLKRGGGLWGYLAFGSMGLCAVALLLQHYYTAYLVRIQDFSALMDTEGVPALGGVVMLWVALVLNGVVFVVRYFKNKGSK